MRISTTRVTAGAIAAFALALSGLAAVSATTVRSAHPSGAPVSATSDHKIQRYAFTTVDDPADPTFNQVLGVNNEGALVGYYGSGMAGHPNRGYKVVYPYGPMQFADENYPGAAQTQVVGINLQGNTAGFWVDKSGNNFGFVKTHNSFATYKNPKTTGTVNQLLAINQYDVAVGFYTDSSGQSHGYTVDTKTKQYADVIPPNSSNVTAAGINNNGDVVGFYTAVGGAVVGFVRSNGTYTSFSYPGATATTPFGINDHGTIVGSYVDKAGASHGFIIHGLLTMQPQYRTLDDPKGVGTTVINGINGRDEVCGFYVDANMNTNGFVAIRYNG